MATVLIEYKGNVDGLEASLKEIEKANEQVSDSAKQSAKEVSDEYRKVAQASKAAFASEETKKALAGQTAAVDKLKDELELLFKEEVKLLQQGKKSTEQYKKNREEAARVRAEFDKLNTSQNNQVKAQEKGVQAGKKLTTQLRELKEELSRLESQGKVNTAEFQKVAISAAKLEDQIGDTQERIKTLASDTFVFDAAVDSVRALAGGFAVAQGAIGLFAEENEDLQRAIAKTNSALAILNGLNEVANFLTGQGAGKLGLQTVAQKAFALTLGKTAGALRVVRVALVGLGIGALLIAIDLLVNNFDRVKQAAFNIIPGLKEVSKFIGNVIDKVEELIGINDNSDEVKKAVDSIIGAEDRKTKFLEKQITRRIELEQALGRNTKQLEIEREQLQIDSAKRRIELLKNNQAELVNLNEDERKEIRDLAIDLNQEVLDRENAIKILRINNEKEITQEISNEFLKRARIILKIDRDLEKERDEIQKDLAKFRSGFLLNIDETTNEELLNQRATFLKRLEAEDEGGLQNRINIIRTEGDAQIAGIEERLGFTRDANNQVALIEAETQERIREERRRTNIETAELTIAYVTAIGQSFNAIADLAKENAERQIEQIERIAEVERIAIENSRSSEAQKQREREALEKRTTRTIIEERRKIARLEKATGIFDAVVNTAVAITNALKQDPPLSFILAAAAGITGATQIAKISSEPLPSFGKGGWIDGEKHSSGGVNINAEGGEYITSASNASGHKRELEAMNTSRAAFLKVIEERYVRPRLMEYALNKNSTAMNVNVDARLNSSSMENELRGLRKDTRNTNKAISKAFSQSYSSRYNWN